MHALLVVSVTIHLLAMAVWVGGMLAFVLVLLPVLRDPELAPQRSLFLERAALRVRWIGWTCLALLAATGLFQVEALFGFRAAATAPGSIFQVLRLKMALFAALVGFQGMHDFWIGPRATHLALADPGSPEARRWRLRASRLGRLPLVLTLVLVVLGVFLVRGLP